ncbi:monooxygenase [Deinococcus humi]|uniref:2-polyprenyl-6-methoxyphenol hydroxylase-like FAD-dependent oxidoreductase n=1 Tax=Deinococcus humi TaxID=662880 RepID=A0A7W8JXC5_9DEIO|nr:monooxygenase [Deinococcus humi]MBB5363399.1 2-polyprenyl-6-methoxyphenol hydroxylase-like FAD-dependent oxidoreductase [Deinococcus humi]GGO26713.1 FAD-binding monooxygenase [Deinococcus humi]
MKVLGERAIVIGGSMGGLLAARALADAFEHVTLLERDEHPEHALPRKGVPQGRHLHGLLGRGREVLELFFPGITEDLVQQGAMAGDLTEYCLWVNEGAPHVSFTSGLRGVVMSRPLIETTVRRRLLEWSNVEAINGVDVQGLLTSLGGCRITGVRSAPRGGDGEQELAADLVVDACGRGSHSPAWLKALGYPAPPEDFVRTSLTYTTRVFQRRPGETAIDGGDVPSVVCSGSTRTPRSGFMVPVEGDRWIVTLAGILGDEAPTDLAGFLAFARSLPISDIYTLVSRAQPLDEGTQFKFPGSRRRRYEQLDRFPQRYLAFGDAICSFNPVYGQGMTVAATEALELQYALAEGFDGLARRFFTRAAKAINVPWDMAVGSDLRFEGVEGHRIARTRFVNWYVGKLHQAAWKDPVPAMAFQRVANLLDSPAALLQPRVAWHVLHGNLAYRRSGQGAAIRNSSPS